MSEANPVSVESDAVLARNQELVAEQLPFYEEVVIEHGLVQAPPDYKHTYQRQKAPTPLTLLIYCALDINYEKPNSRISSAYSVISGAFEELGLLDDITSPVCAKTGNTDFYTVCSAADNYFATISDIYKGGNGVEYQDYVDVYIDDDIGPVAIRKSYSEPTGMLLVPHEVAQGLLLPIGTIVSLGRVGAKKIAQCRQDETLFRTFGINNGWRVTPERLSSFAFVKPLDRAQFALSGRTTTAPNVNTRLAEKLAIRDIEAMRQSAEKILEICGVA